MSVLNFESCAVVGSNVPKNDLLTIAAYGAVCLYECHDALLNNDVEHLRSNGVKVLHAGMFAKIRGLM